MQIRDCVALVTGANRGIGQQFVRALLDAGAKKVYAAARDTSKLAKTLSMDKERVVALRIDVTEPASVSAAASAAKDVTLLVNNAAVLEPAGVFDMSLESVERAMDANFFGKLRMARAFAPVIEHNGGGGIVNVLTLLSLASMPSFASYNASKAAAWSLNMSLRAALASRHISVHGVFPGAVDTDMLAGVEMAKTPPLDVAKAAIAGVVRGDEDIFPDPMSQGVYAAWRQDHKAVEKQFAAY